MFQSETNGPFGVQWDEDIFIYTASQPSDHGLQECLLGTHETQRVMHCICTLLYIL